jgi:hypothetical protein
MVTSPQARWVLQFERDIQVRRLLDGGTVETTTLYVGQFSSFVDPHPGEEFQLRFFVPASDQPATELVRYPGPSGDVNLYWPLKAGHPVNFHEVVAVRRQ